MQKTLSEEHLQLLNFIETDDSSSLFAQRESGYDRLSYEMEKTLYSFIRSGKPEDAKAFYRKMLLNTPSFKIHIGKTAQSKLQQLKYAAVSAIALACRAAIEGGAVESIAYGMSDDAILAVDSKHTIVDVLKIEIHTLIEYATLVQHSKGNELFSPAVRSCIDYLTVHSHQNIALDGLSECSDLSADYLAKLFKKETGMSFVDYHLNLRIEEAKTLLSRGKPCSEVAYILGFSTQSYFIRQFKKVTGLTPRQYSAMKMDNV